MNRSHKIILVTVSSLVVLCLCIVAAGVVAMRSAGWYLARTFVTNPATVAEISSSITDYTLPAGFSNVYAARVASFSLVSYTGNDGHTHIYLFQVLDTLNLDQAEIERQMRQASGTDEWAEVTVIDRQPCQVRGQQTTMVISEGLTNDNQRYRSASAVFEGKGGLALVTVSGPVATWDQNMVEAFIESLH